MDFEIFIDFHGSACWLVGWLLDWLASWLGPRTAGLARLAGKSVWLLGFVGKRLEPCSPPRLSLGEVGGFSWIASWLAVFIDFHGWLAGWLAGCSAG